MEKYCDLDENIEDYIVLTKEEINNCMEIDSQKIELDIGKLFFYGDGTSIRKNVTDFNRPMVISKNDNYNCLYINAEYYKENIMQIQKFILNVIKNFQNNRLLISDKCLITSKTIEAISKNENIQDVFLACDEGTRGFTLTKEDYLKLIENHQIKSIHTAGVSEELEDNYDSKIYYNYYEKKIIDNYSFYSINNDKHVTFYNDINFLEIENLKYLNPKANIFLNIETLSKHCLINIVKKIKELGMNNKIIYLLNEKNDSLDELLKTGLIYDNAFISVNCIEYPISIYINGQKKMNDMIKGTESLSPFEKYIHAYSTVKNFKEYKENKDDHTESRELYKILFNDYIVCSGYTVLLKELCKKMGIYATLQSVYIDNSYDEISSKKVNDFSIEPVIFSGHSRLLVHLEDEKYNINGIYISDPTWDSDMPNGTYNHMLMTHDEVTTTSAGIGLFGENFQTELFNIRSMENYVEILKIMLKREQNKCSKNRMSKALDELYFKVADIFLILEDLIPKGFDEYNKKYHFYPCNKEKSEEYNIALNGLGELLLSLVNKEIPGNVIIDGIINSYAIKSNINVKKLNNLKKQLIETNRKYYLYNFPKREKIMQDGTRIVMNDWYNKFDIQTEKCKKR